MKKGVKKQVKIFADSDNDTHRFYRAIIEFSETQKKEEEKKEKQVLLKQINVLTKNKSIVLENYTGI